MHAKLYVVAVVFGVLALSGVRAEESAARSDRRVELDVVIAEQSISAASSDVLRGESGEDTLNRIRELEAQGKLTALTRVHLSARAGASTSIRIGDRSAAGSRAAAGDRGRGGFPEGFGGRTPDPSEAATVVAATPAIAADGTITVELQVEKTGIEDRDTDEGVSSRVITVTAQAEVCLQDGETVVVHRFDGRSQEGAADDRQQQHVIVVTAYIAAGRAVNTGQTSEPPAGRKWTVFKLQAADATVVADTLRKVIPIRDLEIVADSRTNSLLVTGPEAVVGEVESILNLLDAAEPAPKTVQ